MESHRPSIHPNCQISPSSSGSSSITLYCDRLPYAHHAHRLYKDAEKVDFLTLPTLVRQDAPFTKWRSHFAQRLNLGKGWPEDRNGEGVFPFARIHFRTNGPHKMRYVPPRLSLTAALPAERRVLARRGRAGETFGLFEHPAEVYFCYHRHANQGKSGVSQRFSSACKDPHGFRRTRMTQLTDPSSGRTGRSRARSTTGKHSYIGRIGSRWCARCAR